MSSSKAPPISSSSSSSRPTPTPGHSRSSSIRSQNANSHAPINPSGLREAHTLSQSPEDDMKGLSQDSMDISPRTLPVQDDNQAMQEESGTWSARLGAGGLDGTYAEENDRDENTGLLTQASSGLREVATETTALLRRPVEYVNECTHGGECNHGTFSPRPMSRTGSAMSYLSGGKFASGARGIFGGLVDGSQGGGGSGGNGNKKMSSTARFAQEHGIKTSRSMWVSPLV